MEKIMAVGSTHVRPTARRPLEAVHAVTHKTNIGPSGSGLTRILGGHSKNIEKF